MSDLTVTGQLNEKPNTIAVHGKVGDHLKQLRQIRVGEEVFKIDSVWPSYDGITSQPDPPSPTWFIRLQLANGQHLPGPGAQVDFA